MSGAPLSFFWELLKSVGIEKCASHRVLLVTLVQHHIYGVRALNHPQQRL